jgi:hypothetical protein
MSASKGKVERPFRTVKEIHETLYHFHEPKDEEEANAWLINFLVVTTLWNIAPSRIRAWKTGLRITQTGGRNRFIEKNSFHEIGPYICHRKITQFFFSASHSG